MKLFLLFLCLSFVLGVVTRRREQRTRIGIMIVVSVFVTATYYFVFRAV